MLTRIPAQRFRLPVLLAAAIFVFGACQSVTPTPPPPLTVTTGMEFTLAPGQSAAVIDAVFTVRLIEVVRDERCPLEIECAESGPVTLAISLQQAPGPPTEYALQTFTDNDGRSPAGHFEGIQDQIDFEGYLIQVKSVLPFPARSFDEIKDYEYRVAFLVTEK